MAKFAPKMIHHSAVLIWNLDLASTRSKLDMTNKIGVSKQPIKEEEDKTSKMGVGEQPMGGDQERWSDFCYRSMLRTTGGIRAFLYGENID